MIDVEQVRAWTQVAQLETDRPCDGCGYNLHGQAIRREPATGVLMVRCPECGRLDAAANHTLVGQLWIRRLMSVLTTLWVALLVVGSCWIVMVEWMFAVVLLEIWDEQHSYDFGRATTFIVIGCLLGGFVCIVLLTALVPHWRKSAYAVVAVAHSVVLIALTEVATLNTFGAEEPPWYPWLPLGLHGTAGLAAVGLGRPLARGLVRLLLPRSLRPAMAYLWTCDGLAAPRVRKGDDGTTGGASGGASGEASGGTSGGRSGGEDGAPEPPEGQYRRTTMAP